MTKAGFQSTEIVLWPGAEKVDIDVGDALLSTAMKTRQQQLDESIQRRWAALESQADIDDLEQEQGEATQLAEMCHDARRSTAKEVCDPEAGMQALAAFRTELTDVLPQTLLCEFDAWMSSPAKRQRQS